MRFEAVSPGLLLAAKYARIKQKSEFVCETCSLGIASVLENRKTWPCFARGILKMAGFVIYRKGRHH